MKPRRKQVLITKKIDSISSKQLNLPNTTTSTSNSTSPPLDTSISKPKLIASTSKVPSDKARKVVTRSVTTTSLIKHNIQILEIDSDEEATEISGSDIIDFDLSETEGETETSVQNNQVITPVLQQVEYQLRYDGPDDEIPVPCFGCKECKKQFHTFDTYKNHLADKVDTVSCMYCDVTFTGLGNYYNLHQHLKIVHEIYYSCDYCKEIFPDLTQKENHKCGKCRHLSEVKLSASTSSNIKHLVINDESDLDQLLNSENTENDDIPRPNIKCMICKRNFNDIDVYNSHIESKGEILSCKMCNQTFMGKLKYARLHKHVGETHGSFPYCLNCKKIFQSEYQLSEHWKTACMKCRPFTTNVYLESKIALQPYTCKSMNVIHSADNKIPNQSRKNNDSKNVDTDSSKKILANLLSKQSMKNVSLIDKQIEVNKRTLVIQESNQYVNNKKIRLENINETPVTDQLIPSVDMNTLVNSSFILRPPPNFSLTLIPINPNPSIPIEKNPPCHSIACPDCLLDFVSNSALNEHAKYCTKIIDPTKAVQNYKAFKKLGYKVIKYRNLKFVIACPMCNINVAVYDFISKDLHPCLSKKSYKCPLCNKSKSEITEKSFIEHLDTHCDINIEHVTCDKCGKTVFNTHNMSIHNELSHKEITSITKMIEMKTPYKITEPSKLLQMVPKSSKKPISKRKIVNKFIPSLNTEVPCLRCCTPSCYQYIPVDMYHEHKLRHIYECKFCKQLFPIERFLKYHLGWSLVSRVVLYEYYVKDELLFAKIKTDPITILTTEKLYTEMPPSAYVPNIENQCPVCFEQFQFHCQLSKHQYDKKHDWNVYQCSECRVQFGTLKAMETHSKNHKDYYCNHCPMFFTTIDDYFKHIDDVHEVKNKNGEVSIECQFCLKLKSYNVYTFQKHFEKNHLDNKFSCQKCNIKLCSKMDLIKHMIISHNIKPYACKSCGFQYSRRQFLAYHLQECKTLMKKFVL